MTEASNRKEELARQVHHRYIEILLDKINTDHYPSNAILDLLEKVTHGTERAELIDVLLAKIEQDRYPSLHMLDRVARLAG